MLDPKAEESKGFGQTNPNKGEHPKIEELKIQLKGSSTVDWLFEEVLNREEVAVAKSYIAQRNRLEGENGHRPQTPHVIDIYAFVRHVDRRVAALDLGLLRELLMRQRYDRLRSELGLNIMDYGVDLRCAWSQYKLVVSEYWRLVVWDHKQIGVNFDSDDTVWLYLWKLACAARRGGYIDPCDFSHSTQPRNLADWKHRLTSQDNFPVALADQISSSRGRHRLEIAATDVCVIPLREPGAPA